MCDTLILTRQDLIALEKETHIKNITVIDFNSAASVRIKFTDTVIFRDDNGEQKIIKNRHAI